MILLLLIVVKGNRKWQAWLIVLPLLAVMIAWRLFANLLSFPPSVDEPFGGVVVSLAAAWAIVWLLGHWLAGRNRIVAFFSSLFVLLILGGVSYWCFFGVGSGEDLAIWSMLYGTGSFVLLLATTLSGFCCRDEYRPGVFMAWMVLWSFLVSVVGVPIVAVVAAVFTGEGLLEILTVFFQALFVVLMFAGMVSVAAYVMNLPFMLLATRSAFFRQRFRRFFHLTDEPLHKSAVPPVVALGSEL